MIIGVIPDVHHPYCDSVKLARGIQIFKKNKVDAVVQIGDLYDQLSFSNFPKDLSKCINPNLEARQGRVDAELMW